ncbi:TPA: hypothetical protein HH295_18855 [Xanthomonas vasicola pv. zeae]|uniref:Uncharacterized protein n=3 Tax=Xanthomonas vasicola TaxID=56459 RepID=A0A836ZT71_XANVA|nr:MULTISPECIES: hypothetical protein [Xanthomonas]AVQ08863.1 hypothetical protein C7V42_22045 [Xanthomonas vasicola pv. vasculorum]AZM73112.1 hypothetical protein CXP37_22345 [Xanthomonas vasicola pv. vasculorum]KEZ97798.1 hypothetical protein A11M_0108960 [Xanthomonas vasicola pv. vasculorum NCPPB 895]KFA32279.1 hypothetical protein KW5_0100540 [Xanthomonas vasicola pv. vasculorum NCPPB 1326]KFA33207.1 hypothetical protein KWG_0105645 [Xanthomonas vasicola pv. vasculorum NCPPB 1381]
MRILIQHRSIIRKFIVLETSDRDGSLSLIIRRNGVSTSLTSWSNKVREQEPKITEFDQPRPKNKRITIHQSGRVNFHQNGSFIFVAPLTQTKQPFPIYGYRVPSLDRLDVHDDDIAEEDAVLDLSDLPNEPVSFFVILGPSDFTPKGRAIKLAYEAEGYSVTLQVDPVAFPVPENLNQHFTTLIPDRGLFAEQQMAEDQAMISYHHALTGASDLVLYAPNGEGMIRLIFSVPMRIAPRFKIELADPELHVSDQDVERDGRSEKVMLKFKVRHRKSGQVIRQPVAIKSIELDAEL